MSIKSPPVRARALSMTSLIDVIFLLLLFFMLSSTFSRFAELPLTGAAGGGQPVPDAKVLFLRLSPDEVMLNGRIIDMQALPERLHEEGEHDLLVALNGPVTAQRLTDLLVALAATPDISVKVLE